MNSVGKRQRNCVGTSSKAHGQSPEMEERLLLLSRCRSRKRAMEIEAEEKWTASPLHWLQGRTETRDDHWRGSGLRRMLASQANPTSRGCSS